MKKLLFTFTLLITLSSFGQKQKSTLFLRDGTTLEGLAKITPFNKIKFRATKKSKKVIYDSKTVKSIIIQEKKSKNVEYVYRVILDRDNPILLIPLKKGKITIYKEIQKNPGGTKITALYLSNKKEIIAHKLGYINFRIIPFIEKGIPFFSIFNNTKKSILKKLNPFIKDCPIIVKKLNNNEFKRHNLIEIVQYYNENCGE